MMKTYLRYVHEEMFGVVTSPKPCCVVDHSHKIVFCPAVHEVRALVSSFHISSYDGSSGACLGPSTRRDGALDEAGRRESTHVPSHCPLPGIFYHEPPRCVQSVTSAWTPLLTTLRREYPCCGLHRRISETVPICKSWNPCGVFAGSQRHRSVRGCKQVAIAFLTCTPH